ECRNIWTLDREAKPEPAPKSTHSSPHWQADRTPFDGVKEVTAKRPYARLETDCGERRNQATDSQHRDSPARTRYGCQPSHNKQDLEKGACSPQDAGQDCQADSILKTRNWSFSYSRRRCRTVECILTRLAELHQDLLMPLDLPV